MTAKKTVTRSHCPRCGLLQRVVDMRPHTPLNGHDRWVCRDTVACDTRERDGVR